MTELTADVDLLREKLERAERRVAELEPALAAANAQLATLLPKQTDEGQEVREQPVDYSYLCWKS